MFPTCSRHSFAAPVDTPWMSLFAGPKGSFPRGHSPRRAPVGPESHSQTKAIFLLITAAWSTWMTVGSILFNSSMFHVSSSACTSSRA